MPALTLSWIQLAVVVGALQGVLLTAVLFAQRHNRAANRLLATLVFAFTLYLASSVYYETGLVRAYPHFFGVGYPLPWSFGPLVFLYAVAASDRAWRFTPRAWLHLAPLAVVVLATVPYYVMSGDAKVALYERIATGDIPMRILVLDPTKYASGIAYSIATVIYVRGHAKRVEHSYSNTARVNLAWLLWLSGAAACIWAMATTLPITDFGERLRDEHVALAVAILVYAIGYAGLRQPEIFRFETSDRSPQASLAAEPAPGTAAESAPGRSQYERSGLDAHEAEQLRDRLLATMDATKLWQDSELTLADLAAKLDSTPHKLSEVLNVQVGQTFYDFVNGYRVREVQRRIKAGEAQKFKMLSLALDAGFASKSTFNQVFKKHTNLTPSDFRAAVGA
jgi:AraC-like DNA-binding protein